VLRVLPRLAAPSTTMSGIEIVAFCVKLDLVRRSDFGNVMARIFISHSSKNNMRCRLSVNGFSQRDCR
jgi:hypothetical protein